MEEPVAEGLRCISGTTSVDIVGSRGSRGGDTIRLRSDSISISLSLPLAMDDEDTLVADPAEVLGLRSLSSFRRSRSRSRSTSFLLLLESEPPVKNMA